MSLPSQVYLSQVAQCAGSAAAAVLPNERDKYLRAQAAWQALAERELGIKAAREQRDGERTEAARLLLLNPLNPLPA